MSIYIYVCLVYLVIKSYKLLISCCIYKNTTRKATHCCMLLCVLYCYSTLSTVQPDNEHYQGRNM